MDTSSRTQTPNGPGGADITQEDVDALLRALVENRQVLDNYVEILESKSKQLRPPHRKSWWGRHCWPNHRRTLYRNIVVITVTLQVLNLIILTLIDAWPRHDEAEFQFLVSSASTMIVLQVLNLILIILASGRLAKQIYKHSVNSLLLGQCYLATIMLFAGIYTLTYRLKKHSWKFISEDMKEDPAEVFVLYTKFLFYSISTATLCGSDNVLPVSVYNCLFASLQMLLSFCYFASILGMGLTSPAPSTSASLPRLGSFRAVSRASTAPFSTPSSDVEKQRYIENEPERQMSVQADCYLKSEDEGESKSALPHDQDFSAISTKVQPENNRQQNGFNNPNYQQSGFRSTSSGYTNPSLEYESEGNVKNKCLLKATESSKTYVSFGSPALDGPDC